MRLRNWPLSGSPARAGIGPEEVRVAPPAAGFPRASGDRPMLLLLLVLGVVVPPRERG